MFNNLNTITIGAENITYWNGFDFNDVMYCIMLHQMNSVRLQRCNGLHHVITTLELQGQNRCIKQIPGNFMV